MSHTYKPGDPIEVSIGTRWIHEGRTYVGEWRGQIVCDVPGVFQPEHAPPEYVRPYTPPIEIPEGWTLMRCGDVDFRTDEVYDSDDPHNPWIASTVGLQPGVLVVARRRADA